MCYTLTHDKAIDWVTGARCKVVETRKEVDLHWCTNVDCGAKTDSASYRVNKYREESITLSHLGHPVGVQLPPVIQGHDHRMYVIIEIYM